MAFEDVTAAYVDIVSHNKYTDQTSVTVTFDALKSIYSQYLNPAQVPDKKYTHGLALLLCHYYALGSDVIAPVLGNPDTSVGPVTSEKVGQLSQTRGLQPYIGTIAGFDTWLVQSPYGVEFLFLMKTFKPTPIVL